jgi:hypothetical protein
LFESVVFVLEISVYNFFVERSRFSEERKFGDAIPVSHDVQEEITAFQEVWGVQSEGEHGV